MPNGSCALNENVETLSVFQFVQKFGGVGAAVNMCYSFSELCNMTKNSHHILEKNPNKLNGRERD